MEDSRPRRSVRPPSGEDYPTHLTPEQRVWVSAALRYLAPGRVRPVGAQFLCQCRSYQVPMTRVSAGHSVPLTVVMAAPQLSSRSSVQPSGAHHQSQCGPQVTRTWIIVQVKCPASGPVQATSGPHLVQCSSRLRGSLVWATSTQCKASLIFPAL